MRPSSRARPEYIAAFSQIVARIAKSLGELRKRAEQAVQGYVGHTDTLRRSIDLACRLVEDVERK